LSKTVARDRIGSDDFYIAGDLGDAAGGTAQENSAGLRASLLEIPPVLYIRVNGLEPRRIPKTY
jgi:hypothetical protein